MVTLIDSPQVAFVSGSRLPASSSFSFSRLVLPILCVSLGVSVGSATGLTLAIVNARNQTVATSSNSNSASAPAANLAMNAGSAQATQPLIAAPPIVTPGKPVANTASNPAVELRPAKLNPTPAYATRAAATPSKVEMALNTAPDALKPATFKLEGKEYRAARMIFAPAAKPERHEAATAQAAVPNLLNPTQWSLDAPSQASLYTEGDLTVSDYDASTSTIQTSDGKTFVLGTTVAAGNATSWETYRSDVRYRCDQNGSCVLMRPGVVAPNAKLI